jgi:mono/diheme cytochrome c family protein
VICTILLVAALAFVMFKTGSVNPFRIGDNVQVQIAQGRSIYAARCAICHGRNLEGQPDWKRRMSNGRMPAPPHDASGHTWHHPDDALIGITKYGLKPYAGDDYESDMPAFAGTLSDAEIAALWAYIKSTWPERERQYQQQITLQSKGTKP